MTAAQSFWLSYLILAFGVMPAIFRLRFGRWPYAYTLRRSDAYLWIDLAYGAITVAFTACLFLDGPRDLSPITRSAGFALGLLAIALITWSASTLGPAWRIGQDRAEQQLEYITAGLYRLTRHPIYIALIMLAISMILLGGTTMCTIAFSAATIVYAVVQATNENRRWQRTS